MSFDKLLAVAVVLALPFDAVDALSLTKEVKISPVDIVIVLAFIIVLLKQLAKQTPVKITLDLLMIMLLTFVFSLINLAWVPAAKKDLTITFHLLEYLGLFYVLSQVIKDEAFMKLLMRLFLLIAVFVSVLTILKSVGFSLGGMERHPLIPIWIFRIGVVALEDQFAPFSLILVGAWPLLWQKDLVRRRWVRGLLSLILIMAAVITAARGLYVAMAAVYVIRAYLYFRNLTGNKKIFAMVGLLAGVIILIVVSLPLFQLLDKMRPRTVNQRLETDAMAISLSSTDFLTLLFGYGKGNFLRIAHMPVHNFLLDILVSKGVIGLILIVALLGMIFYRLAAVPDEAQSSSGLLKRSLMLGFFGLIAVGSFDVTTTSIIFWTYLALIYAFARIPRIPVAKAWDPRVPRAHLLSRVRI